MGIVSNGLDIAQEGDEEADQDGEVLHRGEERGRVTIDQLR